MFDGLFSFFKNVFVFAIIIIAIAFVLFVVWLVYDSKKTAEHNRKVAEQKRKDEEFFTRRRKYYLEGLHPIYDHRPTSELLKIYDCLEIMHYNDYTPGFDAECTPDTVHAYCTAKEKLFTLLGKPSPKWKWMYKSGDGGTDHPALVTEDMNYVYSLIQSRK